MTTETPRTEAGRSFLGWWMRREYVTVTLDFAEVSVAAIEAESFAAGRAAVLGEDSLDAAWAAVEAVLPKSRGRWGYSIARLDYTTHGWRAVALGNLNGEHIEGYGASPAAALHTLAARAALAHPAEAEPEERADAD